MNELQHETNDRAAHALRWDAAGRGIIFVLAASSILCLLVEFYRPGWMRPFTLFAFLPAMGLLFLYALYDWASLDGTLCRSVLIGAAAGLIAAVAYDVFRLPFVYADKLGIGAVVPYLPLFKVFPRFGVLILGQPMEQPAYSLSAQLVGWAYHFSNGLTFGIMYVAMVGDPRRRHWLWAVLMAVGLELGMLLTPYPAVFGIKLGSRFVIVTLAAHLIFGVVLGLAARGLARRHAPDALSIRQRVSA